MAFVVRVSLLFKTPPHVVLTWPGSTLRLIERYLSKVPAPEERAEYMLAQLTSKLINSKIGKAGSPTRLQDFLLFKDAFTDPETDGIDGSRYTAEERKSLATLMGD